jgi:ubiquitin carboxyl-terminal hydrolase 25
MVIGCIRCLFIEVPCPILCLIEGSVAYGHYWIYIYDFAGNRWFKYNDEQVTEVDEKVVFANDSAEGAGPYFVTYVKEDAANELVEALKRDLSGNLMSFED